jgi:hypothetical protein
VSILAGAEEGPACRRGWGVASSSDTREDGIQKRIWLEYDLLLDCVANELGGIGSRAVLKRLVIACETRFHYEVNKPVAIHNTTAIRCTKKKPKKRRIAFRKKKADRKKAFKIKKAARNNSGIVIKKEPRVAVIKREPGSY